LQLFRGRAMALVVADVLGAVCDRVLIEAPRSVGYEALGLPVIHAADEHAGKGPLAGMVAGLGVDGADRIAFAPCDMPLIGAPVYDALLRAGGGAYAVSPNGVEPLVAVLAAAMRPTLLAMLALAKIPRVAAALEAAGARAVAFDDAAAFANVNTSEDLARLALPR
jgi:molybdopterin-guanine dinucleotide biosynthesis protein A